MCVQKLQDWQLPSAPLLGAELAQKLHPLVQGTPQVQPCPSLTHQIESPISDRGSVCAKAQKQTHGTKNLGIFRKSCQLLPNSLPQPGGWL